MGIGDDDPLAIAQAWQEAANERDIEQLLMLSDPEIEIVGPRGSGFGSSLLKEWLERAGLKLTTVRAIEDGNTVLLEQRGVWRDRETGYVTGERTLASVFQVYDRQVVKFARFDNFETALKTAGLA